VSVVANVAINVDSRDAVSKLRQVEAQAGRTEKAFGAITAVAGKLAVAFAALEAGRFIVAKTSELESQTKSLEVLTGSVEKATKIIQELQQLGAVTPFTSTELIDAAKRLNAFGVEAENVVETTRRLADVSGATGAELQGLVTAYGQVQAKGRLQGEELLQFQERGVALQKELQKMYGLSGKELQDALSKGRISAEAVEVAIVRLTNAGGKYANGAIAQSDTLNGKFSTLTDGVEQLARTIGQRLSPIIKTVLSQAIDAVNQINTLIGAGLSANFSRRIQGVAQQLTFGARGAALEGTRSILQEIQRAPQRKNIAGIQAQLDAVNQVNAQLQRIGAQGLPDNVITDIMQQQSAISALRKELQGYLQDLQKAQKPKAQQTPATPELLAGTQPKPRRKSLDELIGGDIERTLEARQAFNELQTAQRMGGAGTDQAKRMVEFIGKYRSIANQILAIDETISQVQKKTAVLRANGINVEEKLRDLSAERRNLASDLNVQLQTQYNQAAEAESERLKAVDELFSGAQAELNIAREKDPLKRTELQIEQQLKSDAITKLNLTDEQLQRLKEILKTTASIKTENDKNEQVLSNIATGVAGAFSSALDAVTDRTKTLGEALSDIGRQLLATIGKMLIMYSIGQALGALSGGDTKGVFGFLAKGFGFQPAKDGAYWSGGFQAFADGGLVTKPTMGLVGEGGEAEYIIPASKMRGAMQRYAAGARGSAVIPTSGESQAGGTATAPAPGSIDVRYTVERINSVDYVTADQFRAGMAQAAKQGAMQGERRTLAQLRQNTSARRSVGL
jgi:tape measure domain-containing protein